MITMIITLLPNSLIYGYILYMYIHMITFKCLLSLLLLTSQLSFSSTDRIRKPSKLGTDSSAQWAPAGVETKLALISNSQNIHDYKLISVDMLPIYPIYLLIYTYIYIYIYIQFIQYIYIYIYTYYMYHVYIQIYPQ